jgi:ribosomal protein S18 acetylase RimI-like enzyme
MAEVRIRSYRATDRAAVRAIAFATGYMGEPVDWLWGDRESFADVITKYYTDREPESLLVGENDGTVVGYLSGCVESSAAAGSAGREIGRLVRRGVFLRPGLASFFWRSVLDLARDRAVREDVLCDPRFPAHLHVDLLPEGRGKGLGQRLVEAWLARLRERGVPGVHLGTFAENANALGFFARCGFARHGAPLRVPGFRTRAGARMHVQWMVRPL